MLIVSSIVLVLYIYIYDALFMMFYIYDTAAMSAARSGVVRHNISHPRWQVSFSVTVVSTVEHNCASEIANSND